MIYIIFIHVLCHFLFDYHLK